MNCIALLSFIFMISNYLNIFDNLRRIARDAISTIEQIFERHVTNELSWKIDIETWSSIYSTKIKLI